MVAFLAIVQVMFGVRIAQAQERIPPERRTVEEALDRAGQDIGKELEDLFDQLEISGDKLGEKLERWAEENSDELEAWSDKYGEQWEDFGERFSKSLERLAEDQEGVWTEWAERYEKDIERWADRLDSDELTAESIGGFVESNLEMLSKMPLGQMVDQALEDGVGELRDAPWDSLGELGKLASSALQEPIKELESLTGDREMQRAIEKSAETMGRSLNRFKGDIGRNISDREQPTKDSKSSRSAARIRALETTNRRRN